MLDSIVLGLFVIIALVIILLILVQNGKGADMGASFGSGASATLFGSAGTGGFLSKTTSILMAIFFIICIFLAREWSSSIRGYSKYSSFKANNVSAAVPAASNDTTANQIPGIETASEDKAEITPATVVSEIPGQETKTEKK